MDPAPQVAYSSAVEPNTGLTSVETCNPGPPDSYLVVGSSPRTLKQAEPGWAPVMEFTAPDIFQHSPFDDMLNSLKSLSLSGGSGPNYVWLEWEAGDEGIRCPPTTHFVATIDDLTNVLDFDFEDIDGMDDDAGDIQEPPLTGRWTSTSSYNIYMVDIPKETYGDEATEDNPSKKKEKHGRRQRRSKPRHSNTGTGDENNPDGAEDEYNPDQPAFEQAEQEDWQDSPDEQATNGYPEEDNYMPSSEDEISLGDDEFGVPEDPTEQEHFKRRLIVTARSLKKKKQQLHADQDLLTYRWTEVLAAEEYGLERHTADRPPRGRDKSAYQPEYQPPPPRRFITARGNTQDLCDKLDNAAGQPRSIYGSRGRAAAHDDDRHTGYTNSKSGRAEYNQSDAVGLRRDIARHRGAAHPLYFTDEVMDHEFPEGFKPMNIESYDGTTDPVVWIEDFLLHIHMARGDDLHTIKYLPLKLKGPARHWLNS